MAISAMEDGKFRVFEKWLEDDPTKWETLGIFDTLKEAWDFEQAIWDAEWAAIFGQVH
jgi:hypothetical protein